MPPHHEQAMKTWTSEADAPESVGGTTVPIAAISAGARVLLRPRSENGTKVHRPVAQVGPHP